MALELQALRFTVETGQLDDALTKVNALAEATTKFSVDSVKAGRDIAKAKEQQVRAEEKLSVAEAKYADTLEKLKQKQVDFNNALGKTPSAVKPVDDGVSSLEKLIGKLTNQYTDMASGFTKGEAGILNQARNMGVFGAELQPIINLLTEIKTLNKDPFDASLGGVRSITQEFERLQQRANLAAQGIMLTTKQLGEYSKLAAEARGQVKGAGFDPDKGEGLAEYNKLLADSQNKYLETVASVNKLTQAEKDRNDALKQQEMLLASNKAISDAMIREVAGQVGQKSPELQQMAEFYKKQELAARQLTAAEDDLILREQKLAFVNKELAAGLSTASANALFKYQKDLEALGKSADEVSRRMTAFRAGLVERQGHSPFTKLTQEAETTNKRLDHLSRALGPQITDIFVGLATGQSLLTVALQQGGQIRDQIALAGVASSDMGKALSTAAVQMVGSLKDVAVAMGSLFITPFIAGGKAVTDFATKIVFANKTIQAHSLAVAISADSGNKLASFLVSAFSKIPMLIGAAAASVTVFSGVALVALFSVEKQLKSLTTNLILTGGSLGLTTDSAIRMAQSMEQVGVSSSKALDVMTEMAKQGGFTSKEIELVTKSAVDMQHWLGVSVEDTVKQFAKLKEEPVTALLKVAEQTGMVNTEVLAMVISLEQQGKSAEAAALAMQTYGNVTVEQVQRAKQEYTEFAQLMIDIGKGLGKFWDNMKEMWIAASPSNQLTQRINYLNESISSAGIGSDYRKKLEEERTELQRRVLLLQDVALAEEQKNNAQSASAKVMAEAVKTTEKYLTGLQKLSNDRVKAKNEQEQLNAQFRRGDIDQTAYNAGIAANKIKLAKIDEDIAKENKKNGADSEKASKKYQDELKKAINVYEDIVGISDGVTKSYNEQVTALELLGKVGKKSPEQIAEAFGKLEEQQPRFKALVKDFEDYDKAMQAHLGVMKEYKDLNTDSSTQLEFRASLLGKTTEEQRLLTIENEKSVALLKAQVKYEKELKALTDSGLTGETLEASKINLTKEYERQRVLIAKDANLKIAEDYQKQFEAIQKELGDVIFLALTNRGAQAGKKLRDLIKAELMKPITLVINAIIGDVVGGLGIGSGSGLLGAVNTGSSLLNLYNTVSAGFAGLASSVGGMISSVGSATGLSSLSSFGVGMKGATLAPGLAGPTTAGATGAVGAGASVGSTIATYGPYMLAAYVALDQLGILDRWSGDPDAFLVQQATGANQSYSTSTQSRLGTVGFVNGSASIMKNGKLVSEYGETEGISTQAQNAALAVILSLDNAIAETLNESQIKKIAENMSGWYQKSWSVESDTIENFIASRYETILGSLDSSFGKLKDYQKEGETLSNTAVRLITNFTSMKNVFEGIGISTEVVTVTFANSLAEMLGGINNFSSAMQYFYENFFSEDEQIANQTKNLTEAFRSLGTTLPKTKDEFKALLEGALGSGDKSLAASLIKLMPAFNDFISVTEEASTAFKELTDSLLEEINRLRGAILGDAGVSGNVSGLSAEFAILTAQARAGSVTAIEKLPEYSQAIEQAVAASAVNASDVAYARAWLAESLGNTSAVLNGTSPSIVSTGLTQDVSGTTAVNGATALTASASSQSDLIAILVAEIQGLRAEVRADVAANNKTAKILERANQDGETISVTVAA